jgi:predicted dehydrogenase
MVVGCGGGRGSWFVDQLSRRPAYRVVALVDVLPEAARVVARYYALGEIPVFEETAHALAQVACDAVLVATPDGLHTEPVLAALAHHKYVYVEKPLAITLADCLSIVEADRAAGERVMVGFNLRHAPLYRRMRQLVQEGSVGRLLTIEADEFYFGGRTYFRRWNRLRRMSGGLWISKASHDFDILYWIAGATPQRISASARLTHYTPKAEAGLYCHDCALEPGCPDSYLRDPQYQEPLRRQLDAVRRAAGAPPADLCLYNSDKETFDHGIAQVEFAGDVLAVYSLNVVAPFTDRRIRIGGSDATLQGSLSQGELLYWRRYAAGGLDGAERIPLQLGRAANSGHGGGDDFILDSFADFVRGESPRPISPGEASVAVAMGLAATQSSDTGQTVAMTEVAGWDTILSTLTNWSDR